MSDSSSSLFVSICNSKSDGIDDVSGWSSLTLDSSIVVDLVAFLSTALVLLRTDSLSDKWNDESDSIDGITVVA